MNTQMNTQMKDIILKALSNGYRAFISKNCEYGFFTDTEGTRVVSFGLRYGKIEFSGNYTTNRPKQYGTCWNMGTLLADSDNLDLSSLFDAQPNPVVAFDASDTWNYTTLKEYLKTYGKSSGFMEVEFNISDKVTFKPYENACACVVKDIKIKPYDERIFYVIIGEADSTTTGTSVVESKLYTTTQEHK